MYNALIAERAQVRDAREFLPSPVCLFYNIKQQICFAKTLIIMEIVVQWLSHCCLIDDIWTRTFSCY